jgi:hypothetical protein
MLQIEVTPARPRIVHENAELSPTTHSTDRVWMTKKEAAAYAGVSTRTLDRWNVAASRHGRVVRYRRDDIDAFLNAHRQEAMDVKVRLVADPLRRLPRPTRPAKQARQVLADELMDLLKR